MLFINSYRHNNREKKSTPIIFFLLLLMLPFLTQAEKFKFKIKNTSKNQVDVFYKLINKNGNFKLKPLMRLPAGQEKIKEIKVEKGDTIAFYGQDNEDETSAIIRKDFAALEQQKSEIFYIPIVIPVKESSNFESVESLGLKLEHNKVLNFLMKMDSSSMTGLSMLENNFQNVYPLGTFIFVDTRTNRLLLPPLEPSFWNNTETYFTLQDSLYALVNDNHQFQAGAGVTFLAKLFDSIRVNNAEELEFKGKLSLLRWRPSANATIYQIINDKAFESFLQNCYDQIDNPDKEYQYYRLYFLSSYERVDNLEIYGKKFYTFGNEADVSVMVGNPGFSLLSTNLGMVYSKSKTMSNYFSVQNSVLKTKAYDFTPLLFNDFKNSEKQRLVEESYHTQHRLISAIKGEYAQLIDYNPNPATLTLSKIDGKDTVGLVTSIITTIGDLDAYTTQPTDTSKLAAAKNLQIDNYNNKVKIFNSHLKEIKTLIKQLDQTNLDIVKMTESNTQQYKGYAKSSAGLMNEIVVSNNIIRKE